MRFQAVHHIHQAVLLPSGYGIFQGILTILQWIWQL